MLVPVVSLPLGRPPFWAAPYHFCPNSEMQLRCKWLRFPFQVHFSSAACGKHWKNSKLLSGTWIHAVSLQVEYSRTNEYSTEISHLREPTTRVVWSHDPAATGKSGLTEPCFTSVFQRGAWPVSCSGRKGRAVCLWRVSFPHNSLGWQEIFS